MDSHNDELHLFHTECWTARRHVDKTRQYGSNTPLGEQCRSMLRKSRCTRCSQFSHGDRRVRYPWCNNFSDEPAYVQLSYCDESQWHPWGNNSTSGAWQTELTNNDRASAFNTGDCYWYRTKWDDSNRHEYAHTLEYYRPVGTQDWAHSAKRTTSTSLLKPVTASTLFFDGKDEMFEWLWGPFPHNVETATRNVRGKESKPFPLTAAKEAFNTFKNTQVQVLQHWRKCWSYSGQSMWNHSRLQVPSTNVTDSCLTLLNHCLIFGRTPPNGGACVRWSSTGNDRQRTVRQGITITQKVHYPTKLIWRMEPMRKLSST